MASNIEYCDLCFGKHITKKADNYCSQCDEKLCGDCTEHHRLSRASKSHPILSIDKYKQLPPFIRQIKQYCDEHGDILDFYCRSHDDVCCKRCMTLSHKHCKDVEVIEDLVKVTRSSTSLDKFDKTLQDVERNIEIVITDKDHNLKLLEKEKLDILEFVKEKKKEIISHLDELERNFQRDVSNIEGNIRQKIGSVMQKMVVKLDEANSLRKEIEMVKKHASNVQIFLGTRKIEEPVLNLKKYVQSVSENGDLNHTKIEYKFNDQLLNLTKDVKSLGTLAQKYQAATSKLSWEEEKAAQIFTMKQNTIGNIVLKKIQQIDIRGGGITGCTVMKDGSNIFTGQHGIVQGRVLKYNSNGQYISKIILDASWAFDIVPVDENNVIVTGGECGRLLYTLDTHNLISIKNTVKTNKFSYGATYYDGNIISCTDKSGIGRINLSGTKYTQIITRSKTNDTYITSDNNFLYHSDQHTNSVVCYDYNGKKKWTHIEDVLKSPRCITIDLSSNVYVSAGESNNVVVISPDGKQGRQILGPDDGLQDPTAIYYDKERNYLLVVNRDGPALLYAVS